MNKKEKEVYPNTYTKKKLLSFPIKVNNNNNNKQSLSPAGNKSHKYNNKKQSNKGLCCPFACPNCQSLGGNLVKTRYEVINILSDTSDSIFSPMHEKYHDEDHKSVRYTGQIFLSADFVNSFLQNFKK